MYIQQKQVQQVKDEIIGMSQLDQINYLHQNSEKSNQISLILADELNLKSHILQNPVISYLTDSLLDDLQLNIDSLKIAQNIIDLIPQTKNQHSLKLSMQQKLANILHIELYPQSYELTIKTMQKFAPDTNLKFLYPKTINDVISLLQNDHPLYKALAILGISEVYQSTPLALKYKETIQLLQLVRKVPCSFILGPRQSHNLKAHFVKQIIIFDCNLFLSFSNFSEFELAGAVMALPEVEQEVKDLILSRKEVSSLFLQSGSLTE